MVVEVKVDKVTEPKGSFESSDSKLEAEGITGKYKFVNRKLKQIQKKNNNLERQLRNRNKDYLYALKEIEKIKINSQEFL